MGLPMTSISSRWFLPLSFFIFISYIIFLADTADHNFAFRLVGHIPNGDKVAHALLYGVMAFFLNYGLKFRKYHTFQLGSIIVLTFAIIEELSQYYIPSRTFDLGDLGADFVGVILFSIWRKR
jgi:VanZ family protein